MKLSELGTDRGLILCASNEFKHALPFFLDRNGNICIEDKQLMNGNGELKFLIPTNLNKQTLVDHIMPQFYKNRIEKAYNNLITCSKDQITEFYGSKKSKDKMISQEDIKASLENKKEEFKNSINQLLNMKRERETLKDIGGREKAQDLIELFKNSPNKGFGIGDSIQQDENYHIDITELHGTNSLLKLEIQARKPIKGGGKATFAQVNYIDFGSAFVHYRNETTINSARKNEIFEDFKSRLVAAIKISKQRKAIQVIVPQLVFDGKTLTNVTFETHEL